MADGRQASSAVGGVVQAGIVPAAMEMIDRMTIAAVEPVLHTGFPLDADAVLLVEVDERADELAHRLTEQGLAATADGRQIELEIGPEHVALAQDLVVQSVVDLNLSLLRLEQRRRQLEELFEAPAHPGGTRQEA